MWTSRDEAEAALRRHDKAYAEGKPVVSDEEYDTMRAAFAEQWPDSPYVQDIGPVVVSASAADTVVHERPMLSLDKGKYELKGSASTDVLAMWKVDGVACRMLFDDDMRLILAATRGDGKVGQNITEVVAHLFRLQVSTEAPSSTTREVRGELFMPRSVFGDKYAGKFANARNLVAGVTQTKNVAQLSVEPGDLRFFIYEAANFVQEEPSARRQIRQTSEAIRCYVDTYEERLFTYQSYHTARHHPDTREIVAALPLVFKAEQDLVSYNDVFDLFLACRSLVDFEADGVVFRLDDVQEFESRGFTAHHPKGAVAWKFPPEVKTTKVEDVIWQTSRMGVITPVAIIEPVSLSGATVSRVTLHNAQTFLDMGLRPGDIVNVTRRGDVIPHIESVHTRVFPKLAPFETPVRCPSCDGPVVLRSPTLHCIDPANCGTAVMRSMLHFLRTLGCDGIGASAVTALVDRQLIDKRWVSLFELFEDGSQTADVIEAVGPHAHGLLKNTVQRLRTQTVDAALFLEALGIQSVGSSLSRALINHFGDLIPLFEVLEQPDELAKIPSVGPTRAVQVGADLHNRLDDIADLMSHMPWPKAAPAPVAQGPLSGQVIVFTGPLESMGRSQAQARVLYLGGKAADTVNKDTTVVVTNSSEMTTKRKKAEQLIAKGSALRILTEQQFVTEFPSFLA